MSAILIVALTAGFSMPLLTAVLDHTRGGWRPGDALVMGVLLSLVAVPVVALLGLFVAIPLMKVAYLFGMRGLLPYAMLGGAVGMASYSFIIFWLIGFGQGGASSGIATFGCLPGIAGGVYWWRAVDRFADVNPWQGIA